jgi:hypothetical protein
VPPADSIASTTGLQPTRQGRARDGHSVPRSPPGDCGADAAGAPVTMAVRMLGLMCTPLVVLVRRARGEPPGGWRPLACRTCCGAGIPCEYVHHLCRGLSVTMADHVKTWSAGGHDHGSRRPVRMAPHEQLADPRWPMQDSQPRRGPAGPSSQAAGKARASQKTSRVVTVSVRVVPAEGRGPPPRSPTWQSRCPRSPHRH